MLQDTKKMKTMNEELRNLEERLSKSNIHLIGASSREKWRDYRKAIFKEMVPEDFTEVMRNMNPQIPKHNISQ